MTITKVKYSPNCQNPVGYPLKQNIINTGITNSKYGMPQKFNGADGGAAFSMGRNIYVNAIKTPKNCNSPLKNIKIELEEEYAKKKPSCNNKKHSCNIGKSIPVQSSDQYIQRRKNQAIGSGTIRECGNKQLAFKTTKTTQQQHQQISAVRRCRSSGSVVPKSVTSINRKTACVNNYPYCR